MPTYGLLTNPSNEILGEISDIHDLDFDYVEVGIEGPEGNPIIIEKERNEILSLFQKFKNSRERQLVFCELFSPNKHHYTDIR
jgi:hypothetical protein